MSDNPQQIAPDVFVRAFRWPRMPESATGVRWAFAVHGIGFTLSYEEMCAFRRWFLGPDAAAGVWDPAGCSEAV